MACLLGCSLVAQAAYQGHVYVDANRNGRYDKGEKLLQGVCVSDGLNVVKTGKDGSFSLPGHVRHWYIRRLTPVIRRPRWIPRPSWGKVVYCGASDGILYAIDLESGRTIRRHRMGAPVLAGLTHEGEYLYAVDYGGNVYSIRL